MFPFNIFSKKELPKVQAPRLTSDDIVIIQNALAIWQKDEKIFIRNLEEKQQRPAVNSFFNTISNMNPAAISFKEVRYYADNHEDRCFHRLYLVYVSLCTVVGYDKIQYCVQSYKQAVLELRPTKEEFEAIMKLAPQFTLLSFLRIAPVD